MVFASKADKLKALRYTLGLSQAEMADKIGVSESSVKLCEDGYRLLSKIKTPAQSKINAFLEVQDVSSVQIIESKLAMGLEERQEAIHKHFTEGKCYRVYDKNDKDNSEYVFKFLRDEGIHHVFREIHGGWITTYTDPQLIGKTIQEVEV